MRKFEITEVVVCDECSGAGVLTDPFWARFFDSGTEDVDAFASSNGYDPKNLPPEEYDCPECMGTGEERTSVSLQEALASLGYMEPVELRDKLVDLDASVYRLFNMNP